ncbi:DUF6531 domain-containing protein [Lacrimispora sp.]|uniref:DUF6531 domain-containing protein n=1 Tax=Lacrimispora sp. TaxID=2719234 RepID=UPI0028ACFEB6|nr:DUF6531 domain-containing protein [Lacrimispora sp.]
MSETGRLNFGLGLGMLSNQAQKAMDSTQYLVEGAQLYCVNGSGISQLKIPDSHNYTSGGKKKANCKDCKACVNIPYFGECRKNEESHQCEGFMELTEKWESTTVSSSKPEDVSGEAAISMSSVLLCKKGGIIIPVTSGQGYNEKINWAAFLKRYQNVLRWAAGKNMLCHVFGKDPINMNTGNYIYEKEDLIIKGMMPLSFKLFYNVMDCGSQGTLGEGWSHNYGVRLEKIVGEDLLGIVLEDGREVPYSRKLEGEYVSVLGDGGSLSKSGLSYVYEREDGIGYEFGNDGRLCTQRDRNGNCRTFTYNKYGLLESVRNGTGGRLNYTYNKENNLIFVEDHTGRKISLRYQYGKLRWFTNSCGNTYTYEYNENGKLDGIITPREIQGVKNEYDGANRVVKQTMPDGGVVELRYDDENNRTYMKEQNGNLVIYECDERMRNIRTIFEDGEETFAYNDRNQKIRYTDKNGNTTRYSYDNQGNLTQVINALGQKTNMTYDSNGNLISIKQHDGSYTKRYYDKQRNLVEIVNPSGNSTKIIYNDKNMPKTIVLPDNSEINMSYNEKGNMNLLRGSLGNELFYEYDELNRIIKYINANGNITNYRYDSKNNICEVENALGNKRIFEYENDMVAKIIDFNGGVDELQYNEMNRISKYTNANGDSSFFEYDVMGNLTKEVRPNGGSVQYKYNKLNRLEYVINLSGGKTEYKYDANGNIVEVVNTIGGKSLFSYDALNRLISVEDTVGGSTHYSYNQAGKIEEITDGLGRRVSFEYDNCGNIIKKIDSLGKESYFAYNALELLTEVIKPSGEKIHFNYYKGGLINKIQYLNGRYIKCLYDPEENIIGMENENGYQITYNYDELNRVVRIDTKEGAENNIIYDAVGNIISIIDANKNKTEYRYSLTGDIVQVIDPLGNSTKYSYDSDGNIIDILRCGKEDLNLEGIDIVESIQKGLRFNKYERNQMGQIIKLIDGSGKFDTFEYDKAGNLIKRKDREGYQTNLSYTAESNLHSIVYDDGRRIEYAYNPLKQLAEIKDWLGTTKFDYDNFGRLKKITDHNGRQVGYHWDDLGLRQTITYPDGKDVDYFYNQNKDIVRLVSPIGNVQYRYDEKGRLVKKDYSNGITELYQYDSLNRLTSLSYHAADEILDQYEYEYDLKGNKTKVKKFHKHLPEGSGEFVYGYDGLDRLIAVTQDNKVICRYKYDSYGNIICKDEAGNKTRYIYDSLDRLMEEHQAGKAQKYTYDLRGNLSTIMEGDTLVQSYLFGSTNRFENCTSAVGKATYQYNGLGIRVGKTEESEAHGRKQIEYITDQTKLYNNLLQKIENDTVHKYIWDDEILYESTESRTLNYLTDELGSPIRQFEHNIRRGNVICYGAFGSVLKERKVYPQSFGYIGYTKDIFSNSYFAQGREYIPENGRFISEDPLPGLGTYPLSINRYIYCNDDPENTTDKTGLIAPLLAAALVGGAVNVVGQIICDAVTSAVEGEVHVSSLETYSGAFLGGAIGGVVAIPAASTGGFAPLIVGFATGSSSSIISDMLTNAFNGQKPDKTVDEILGDGLKYGLIAGVIGKTADALGLDKLIKIDGITKGRNSYYAISKSFMTKFNHGYFCNLSYKTVYKMLVGNITAGTGENLLSGIESTVEGKVYIIGDFIEEKYDDFKQLGGEKFYEFFDTYIRWYYNISGGACVN